jgi:hypothetical protein
MTNHPFDRGLAAPRLDSEMWYPSFHSPWWSASTECSELPSALHWRS